MLNIVALMGRITADLELRHTPSNVPVVRFSIAVERSYQKPGEERQTDFIDIVVWRQGAEFVCKYFGKGSLIAVNGSLQARSYADNQGVKRKSVEVIADNVHFTGEKKRNDYTDSSVSSFDQPTSAAYSSGDTGDFQNVEDDDDLPF